MPEEDDGYRTELVRGQLVREPVPGALHARVQIRLGSLLYEYTERTGAGTVLGVMGFVVEEDPATVRGPDLALVRPERLPASGYASTFWRLGPDLAVEILSPSNRRRKIQQKLREYFASGTRLAWVVDPGKRIIEVHQPSAEPRLLGMADTLDGGDVQPSFRLPVARISAA
jgi:Uma2 family endonuclease